MVYGTMLPLLSAPHRRHSLRFVKYGIISVLSQPSELMICSGWSAPRCLPSSTHTRPHLHCFPPLPFTITTLHYLADFLFLFQTSNASRCVLLDCQSKLGVSVIKCQGTLYFSFHRTWAITIINLPNGIRSSMWIGTISFLTHYFCKI